MKFLILYFWVYLDNLSEKTHFFTSTIQEATIGIIIRIGEIEFDENLLALSKWHSTQCTDPAKLTITCL